MGIGLLLRAQALVPGTVANTPGAQPHVAAHTMTVRWTSPPSRQDKVHAPANPPERGDAPLTAQGGKGASESTGEIFDARNRDNRDTPHSATTEGHTGAPPGEPAEAATEATFAGYAHRDMLDRPPQALGIVQITYPPGVEPGRVRKGRLTLFIDEAGVVRKVMVWPPTDPQDALPPPFVQAAREAFLQARFAPGERHGVPVKSRIDIEVSFDGRETKPLETAQQPQDAAGIDRSV